MEETTLSYNKEKSCGTVLAKIIFGQVGMFFLVGVYAAFGAWALIQFESGAELKRFADKKEIADTIEKTLDYTVTKLWYYGDEKCNWTYETYIQQVNEDLQFFEDFILEAVSDHKYDGSIHNWEYDWTFPKAMLLTMTIMSTIGYGHITPKTFEGQMFTIFYSLVGCAMFLVFLANLGDLMAKGFTYFYSRVCCRWFRSRRIQSEMPDGEIRRSRRLVMDDDVPSEEYMPTSDLFVPITINIFVLHIYMISGGILFSNWEGWSLTSSFYFTFITLSTVGFGDLVPGNSLLDGESLAAQLKMFTCISYIVFGMALLSMAINLMQQQIIEKCKYVAKEIGLSKNDSVEEALEKDNITSKAHPPVIRGFSPYRRPSLSKNAIDGGGEWMCIPGASQE